MTGTRYHDGSIAKKHPPLTYIERCRATAFIAALDTLQKECPYPPHVSVSKRTQDYLELLRQATCNGGVDAVNEIRDVLRVTPEMVNAYSTALLKKEIMSVSWRLKILFQSLRDIVRGK